MDYYSTLGVPRTASAEEIKKAYRKLAMDHHPDKGGDVNKFQELTNAYETLSNQYKRFEYDNTPTKFQPKSFDAPPSGFNFNFNSFDISDLFGQAFGQRGHPPQQQQLFRTQIAISLVDAYTGKEHILQIATPTGVKVITVKVPLGINHGDQVRYENLIDNGTLIIVFHILPDLRFDRTGGDLYCNLPISVLDLIVGTKVKFTSISGKTIEVTIPPNTQPSQHIRLSGLGMPIKNAPNLYGDQILLIKPYIPDSIHIDIIKAIQNNQVNT